MFYTLQEHVTAGFCAVSEVTVAFGIASVRLEKGYTDLKLLTVSTIQMRNTLVS